jgi:four helix bundle protein
MLAKDYRELRVYKLAFESALRIQELSKNFPPEERYSLTDQIRRSSRSICTNIAEAWRKRRYPNHWVSKLSDSDSESAETIVWLDFCQAFGYLTEKEYAVLVDNYDHICSQLTLMMDEPEKWQKARKA